MWHSGELVVWWGTLPPRPPPLTFPLLTAAADAAAAEPSPRQAYSWPGSHPIHILPVAQSAASGRQVARGGRVSSPTATPAPPPVGVQPARPWRWPHTCILWAWPAEGRHTSHQPHHPALEKDTNIRSGQDRSVFCPRCAMMRYHTDNALRWNQGRSFFLSKLQQLHNTCQVSRKGLPDGSEGTICLLDEVSLCLLSAHAFSFGLGRTS